MQSLKASRLFLLFLFSAIILLLTIPLQARIFPITDAQRLQNAWRAATHVGRFHYQTNAVQTIHPTLTLKNAGRRVKTKQFRVEGTMDTPNERMEMQLHINQAGQERVTELKIEDDQAYGRLKADADWTPIDQSTDLFAPGGNPMGFLVAAENVQVGNRQQATGNEKQKTSNDLLEQALPPSYLAMLTRYTFDLDGVKYAEYMRAQMEEALRRKGELPNKIDLAPVRAYVDMTGSGEIWVNADGLPVHQVIQMQFPPEKGANEWVDATITTNFSDWQQTPAATISLLWQDPARLVNDPLAVAGITSEELQDFSLMMGFMLLMTSFAALLIRYRRSPRLYAGLAASIISSMLVIPLLEAQQLYAFSERQQIKAEANNAEKAANENIEAIQAEQFGRNFNPELNPLEENHESRITQSLNRSISPLFYLRHHYRLRLRRSWLEQRRRDLQTRHQRL